MAVASIPALGLLIGASLALYVPLDASACAWVMLAASACALVLWRRRAAVAASAVIAFGFLLGGAALTVNDSEHALHPSLRQVLDKEFGGFLIESLGPAGRHDPLLTRVVLLEDASPRDDFVSLRARIVALQMRGVWLPVEGGVSISVNGTRASDRVGEWRAGRTIEAPITYRRPVRYLNEGVPDFERDLAMAGTTLFGTIKSGRLIEVVSDGGYLAELCADIRAHVRRAIERWIEPHDPISAAIASAVLIGDRTGLPDETRDALQAAGTYHVIAISGGNIAILAAVATLLLAVVTIRGRRAALIAIVVLSAYAIVITAGPSVWRATLMAILYFAARTLDHRSSAWQSASVAAAVMIVIRPLDVRDAGFILTFGATLALLEGVRIGAALRPRLGVLSWVAASVVASFAIEIALLPVSASLFSRVTGAGLVLNLLAVPLMGVVQIAALVVTLCDSIPAVASPAGWITHYAARALVGSANLVTLAPWSTARVPPPGALVITVYYLALAAMFFWTGRAARALAAITFVMVTLVLVGAVDPTRVHPRESSQRLRATMFDVGQGESILVEMPGGRRVLVDAGGAPFGGGVDIGARVLAPALWARGIRALDTLLITHGDPDHLGGAIDVLSDFAPHRVWMGVAVPNHRPTLDVLDTAARLRIPLELKRRGEADADGELRVRVLHPPRPDWERRRVRNDDSVVLEIVYRDVAILLTGDISAEIEREILPQLTPAKTRILKVAHHGSRTSSSVELLSAWRPQFALISAGRGNTFG
ncbi:MAG TPA: DNA internalization-related competence protein ComEC/Rec2, partial [Vicinamibacterales bacterium]|nr:DNA internalization-related competence protein ComEC/Rec2 [Vicinamibacterales bacterium]